MNKNKKTSSTKHRTLELNKETVVNLTNDQLKNVVGGNTTIPSQCATNCPP